MMVPRRRQAVLLAVVSVVGTVLAFAPFVPIDVDVHHDGLMLKTAMDVRAGQVLFRETFTQYGPLTTYYHAAALSLFGPRLIVLKAVTLAAYALAAVATTAVWSRILPLPLVVAAFLVWLLMAPFYSSIWTFHPWASVVALACQACSTYAFVRAFRSPSPWAWSALAGALAALTFHARTPVGLLHTLALALAWGWAALARRRWTPLAAGLVPYVVGVTAIHALFLWHLVRTDAVSQWYRTIIEAPSQYGWPPGVSLYAALGILFPGVLSLTRLDGFAYWKDWVSFPIGLALFAAGFLALPLVRRLPALALVVAVAVGLVFVFDPVLVGTVHGLAIAIPISVLVVLACALIGLRRHRLDDNRSLELAGAMAFPAVASWAQYFPTTDPQHVFWAASPAVGLLVFAMHRLAGRRQGAVLVALALMLAPLMLVKTLDARAKSERGYVTIHDVPPLVGMRVSPEEADEYGRLHAAIRDREARGRHVPIAILGSNALVATFASNLRNPQAYFVHLGNAPQMRMRPDLLRRFVETQAPLILVDPLKAPLVGWVEKRFNYSELVRTPRRVLMAPR